LTEQPVGLRGWFWADDFDLSALSYPQFLDFFFDRPPVGDDKQYDLFRGGIDYFVASNPATVVAHVRAMCRAFSELTNVYSHEELNKGLWAIFGAGISCEQYLFDPAVDLGLRVTPSSACTCRLGTSWHTVQSQNENRFSGCGGI
jgi:hypothetical protein